MARFNIDIDIEVTDKRQNKRVTRRTKQIEATTRKRALRFAIDEFLLTQLESGTNVIKVTDRGN